MLCSAVLPGLNSFGGSAGKFSIMEDFRTSEYRDLRALGTASSTTILTGGHERKTSDINEPERQRHASPQYHSSDQTQIPPGKAMAVSPCPLSVPFTQRLDPDRGKQTSLQDDEDRQRRGYALDPEKPQFRTPASIGSRVPGWSC